ncbi:hypothetical protein D3C76_790630 [compost metagenome]
MRDFAASGRPSNDSYRQPAKILPEYRDLGFAISREVPRTGYAGWNLPSGAWSNIRNCTPQKTRLPVEHFEDI